MLAEALSAEKKPRVRQINLPFTRRGSVCGHGIRKRMVAISDPASSDTSLAGNLAVCSVF
jgi:hypothetical protein